jgi:hypothetical protein
VQEVPGIGGALSGPRAAAEPGQGVSLVPGTGDRARQFQGGPVGCLGLIEAAPGAVQCSGFVERLRLAARVADVPVDPQRRGERRGRAVIVTA